MGKKLLLIISLWGFVGCLFAQKEANTWYFGNNAGISFKDGKPESLTDGKLMSPEGCATYSTASGRLLFYTDGTNVWDSTHKLMPNGTGLKGDPSATQSSIIIPKPFTYNSYYIFTVDKSAGGNGVCYTEINMSLNGGKGDVVSWRKNILLMRSGCEKITAIKHADGINYWVLLHKFNTDIVYAFIVTYFGPSYFPVKSNTGIRISGFYSHTLGTMKVSPDGKKIAYVNYAMDTSVIADFDALTGKVKNAWIFSNDDAYGLEFSSKSQYLYISEQNNRRILQYNVKAVTKNDFIASRKTVDSNYSNLLGALQIGPDNKIYISETGSSYLHVINAPDSSAEYSHPQKQSVYLNGMVAQLGLPNFNQSILTRVFITVTNNCINDTTKFTISNTNTIDSVSWNFGEPAALADNISNKMNGTGHVYSNPGYYTVWLTYYTRMFKHYAWLKFYVKNPKPRLGNDTVFCGAFTTDIKPHKQYISYQWNNNSNGSKIIVNSKGRYILRAKDSVGCYSSDTVNVINPVLKPKISNNDSVICFKNNLLILKDQTDYDGDQRKSVKWIFGDGTSVSDSVALKEYANTGSYSVKMIVKSANNCSDSVERNLRIIQHPVAKFSFNNPCFPDPVNFVNESTSTDGKIKEVIWDFGDKTTSSAINPEKHYDEKGKYTVKLIVKSDNGCVDSITKQRAINVKGRPTAGFTFKEVSTAPTYKRTVLFSNTSSDDVTSFKWDFGDGRYSYQKNPTLDYLDSGENKFVLWVKNSEGCEDTFSMTTYQKFYFYIPNAFSPDANNTNETLVPTASIYVKSYRMEIFNLWGEKLFVTNDIKTGWDGTYKNAPCEAGVYVCKIYFTPFNGLLEHYEQPVLLLR